MVHIVKYRQQHFLEFLQCFVVGDLIQFAVECHLVVDVEKMVLCSRWFISNNGSECCNIFGSDAVKEQITHSNLQHQPDFKDFLERILIQDMWVHAFGHHAKEIRTGDYRPFFLFGFNQSHHPQPREGFPNNRTADAQRFSQFNFLRNCIPNGKLTLAQQFHDAVFHLIHQRTGVYGFDGCFEWGAIHGICITY